MPGIVGIISRRPAEDCKQAVRGMVNLLQHEQFYVGGTYFAPEMGVYAGWVAHENSFAAGQVFMSARGDIAILLSGECFADTTTLAQVGQGNTPGNRKNGGWLAKLYEEKGSRFWESLNGSFSGLLIDEREGKAFLFNDRYGTERIYWHKTDDALYFASEAKALLLAVPALRQFDPEGVAQFLAMGCTANWRTVFRGIEILPGGSLWTFTNTESRKAQYFDVRTWESLPELSIESFQTEFEATFQRVLPRYFQTDEALGIALTGGLDTRMILACQPLNIASPVSYTFTGHEGETFDDRVAAQVAKACGLEHHLLRLGPDFFSEFPAHADRTVYLTDGCFGITGTHEIYFNKQARQLAPVRLTGLFGSEILRGISTFKAWRPPASVLQPEFNNLIDTTIEEFASAQVHPVASAAFRNIPWNLFGGMAANRSQVVLRSPYLDNEIVALAFQAPEAVRKSARPALQLIAHNNPALGLIPTDRRIEDKGAGFPRNARWLLREVGFKLDYYYNEGMPQWGSRLDPFLRAVNARVRIFGNHKFLHYRSWFRRELASYVSRVLKDARAQESAFWKPDVLDHIAEEQVRGHGNYALLINAILTLEAIERLLFRNLPPNTSWKHQVVHSSIR